MARQVAYIGENQTEPYVYGFDVNLYGKDFTFIPKSVYEKGFVADGKQYYLPGVLNQEFNQAFQPYAKPFSVDEVQKVAPNFKSDYEKSAFDDKQGYLVPTDLSQTYLSKFGYYDVGEEKDGFVFGGITGLATNEQGQRYFNVSASGRPNASAWATEDANVAGQWYDPGKKWYETTLGKVGIALIVAGTAGLALGAAPAAGAGAAGGTAAGAGAAGGAAAGGTAAAGTGLTVGAGGTTAAMAGTAGGTGLTVGSGAATSAAVGGAGTAGVVAPSGFVFAPSVGAGVGAGAAAGAAGTAGSSAAPISTATPVPAGELAYPGVEVAPSFTPAPDSLQAALPGMGVETAASAAPYTAVPGSFQAALPVFGVASSPSLAGNLLSPSSGLSASDALRLANQAKGLLGSGQNPLVPQQQGLPQSGRGSQGVDYSGLLSLLQLQARTPNVASLTAPAQLRQMYQPTLLPNVLSLLG